MKKDADPLDWLSKWPLDQVPLVEAWTAVHTRFGFAAEVASELETGLLMLVSQCQQINERRLSFEDLLEYLEANGALTLGRLVQLLADACALPTELRESLALAQKRRNFLVHHFYRQRAELFHMPEGCKQLEEELLSIQYDLHDAAEQLKKWADTIFGARCHDDILDDIRRNVRQWRSEQDAMLRAILGKLSGRRDR